MPETDRVANIQTKWIHPMAQRTDASDDIAYLLSLVKAADRLTEACTFVMSVYPSPRMMKDLAAYKESRRE